MLAEDSVLDKLSAQVYIKGTSRLLDYGRFGKFMVNALPFEAHVGQTIAFESLCRLNYKNPCKLQFTPLSIRTNSKRGRRILNEAFQVLLPIYSFKRMKDRSSDKAYVVPFSDEGLEQYEFAPQIDTVFHDNKQHLVIAFHPKREHHTLGTGYMIVDMKRHLHAIQFSGRVDFGMVDYYMSFEFNRTINKIIPLQNHVSIGYNYLGTTGVNEFDCYFSFEEFAIKEKDRHRYDDLNLTEVYNKSDYDKVAIYSPRPIELTAEEDSLLDMNYTRNYSKKRSLIEQLPERLVGSSNINAFGNDLKIYGPLDPASFSYSKHDGIAARQRIRFSKLRNDGTSYLLKSDFGYSFKMKELRYKTTGEWIYNPRRRAGISLSASNRRSEFSSKFKNQVDAVLSDTSNLKFNDLGIEYYRRHEFTLEHSMEIANGLMFYVGATYNYRDPVKYGSRKMSKEQVNALVHSYYADFNPYLSLTWTPRQYYHFQNNQKLYIASYYPTFSLELAQGVKHIFGSSCNYNRQELDVQQSIKLDAVRQFSYHVGAGSFFRQKGEYFIAYNYFSRRMFPETWDDHIGGKFHLLDDYWYNSSPAYIQSHVMYESPFMLLHKDRLLSKYIIKERVYLSALWADGKNSYMEMGYGIGNNYFNIGIFSSMIGLKFYEVGFKAILEVDSHW